MWKKLLPFLERPDYQVWPWRPEYVATCWECQERFSLFYQEQSLAWYIRHGLAFWVGRQVATFCTAQCKHEWQHRTNKKRGNR